MSIEDLNSGRFKVTPTAKKDRKNMHILFATSYIVVTSQNCQLCEKDGKRKTSQCNIFKELTNFLCILFIEPNIDLG